MPVELRKRPPPKEPAAPPPAAKRSTVKKLADKAKAAVTGAGSKKAKASAAPVAAATEPEPPVTTETSAPIIPETVPAVAESGPVKANGSAKGSGKLTVGDKIALEGFGGTIQTHDGTSVTVKELIEKSGGGVVLFTYPKASTPGCKSGVSFNRSQAETDLSIAHRHESSMSLPR
jgi:peroxiredoxin Q/BCP